MQDSLREAVSTIRSGSENIWRGATEISSGNNDLSSRTEEQAAALEETAASMEQLTATVKLNAESARQASQLADVASTTASRGGSLVEEVVTTMSGISESSKKLLKSPTSSTVLPSRPISWRSTQPLKRHARASRAAVSPSSRGKSVIWQAAAPTRPRKLRG